MLQLSARRSGETVVLRCTGRIVAGEGLEGLQRIATGQPTVALILDLRGVEILDAAGLGTLLHVRQWCDAQGTNLKLINPNKHVREVLSLTALDSVLEVGASESDDDVRSRSREWACAEK
jgi:anti-anti-sigma factor